METQARETTTDLVDNVEVGLYETDRLRDEIPEWDELSETEKLERLRDEDPETEISSHNVTTDDYRAHLARLANPDVDEAPEVGSHLAFGDDATAPATSDSSLKNEVYRTEVTDPNAGDDPQTFSTITLLSSDEAVGDSLLEAALVDDATGLHLNRVLLSDPENRLDPKTQDYAVTVQVDIIYSDATQV